MDTYIIFQKWINSQLGGKIEYKWSTLKHNGVMFPSEYKKHNVPLLYNGKEIFLNSEEEEYATYYAKYINTEYIKNKKFKKNFWKDWRLILGLDHEIQSLDNCDFSLIYNYLLKKKEEKKNISKEEKENIKKNLDLASEEYKYAIIDGKKQPIDNYKIEQPGLFIGRGCHPKMGRIKKRILPEDVIINIGEGEVIPKTLEGHRWKEIIHNREVLWIASWKDNITKKNKYVFPGDQSSYKAKSDENKYELARKLKKKIGEIRRINLDNLISDNLKNKQLATALYFIDKLALRIGNEKGKNEADTVGVTSLRIEHIKIMDKNKIKLDFLGKDSIRYVKKFKVEEIIFNNIIEFIGDKSKKEDLFDLIKPSDVNIYLQNFMKKLTSKVFRTYNASNLFQRELNAITKKFKNENLDNKIKFILTEFNKANAKVAILCNHQKSVSKNFNLQLEKILNQIKLLRKKKRILLKKKLDMKERNKNTKKIRERIKKVENKIQLNKSKKNLKLEMKNVSTGTSKNNYIDPRITISFLKKNDIPIDKVFSEKLRNKFKWAFEVNKDYIF